MDIVVAPWSLFHLSQLFFSIFWIAIQIYVQISMKQPDGWIMDHPEDIAYIFRLYREPLFWDSAYIKFQGFVYIFVAWSDYCWRHWLAL